MKRWLNWRCFVLAGLIFCLPTGLWWWFRCGPTTTIVLVRHADRPVTGEDALTPSGVERANELVHVARKSGVEAIYRSNTNRSRDTAQPLADALGLSPIVYDANDVSGIVAQIFTDHRGDAVFLVGHSNTVPLIVAEAGGPALPDIADREFDNLLVLTVCPCRRGKATLINLQYGIESPPPP